MNHTSQMSQFATVYGRTVVFMSRPSLTRQKKYREPIVVKKKRYPNKVEAEQAARQWEGLLI